MRYLRSRTIVAVAVVTFAANLACGQGLVQKTREARKEARKNNRAALDNQAVPSGLFRPGEASPTFQLSEVDKPGEPSPEKELLNADANKQAIATLLKDERNKGLKPGLSPPDDKDSLGIKIRFDAIRFLQDPDDPGKVILRLVGPINEVQCKKSLSIKTLLESKEPIPVRFTSVTNNTGVRVTITTDLKLKWDNGDLQVTGTNGTIDFHVGFLSPARLLYSSTRDSTALPDLVGKRVAEEALARRSLLEPEKL